MVHINTTPAAVSVTQVGRAQTVQCPPALTIATIMAVVWMGSVFVIRITQGTTAASRCVQTTAMTRDNAWVENVCASLTSLVRTAVSSSVPMTASVTACVWMAGASVMTASTGTIAHLVSLSHSRGHTYWHRVYVSNFFKIDMSQFLNPYIILLF